MSFCRIIFVMNSCRITNDYRMRRNIKINKCIGGYKDIITDFYISHHGRITADTNIFSKSWCSSPLSPDVSSYCHPMSHHYISLKHRLGINNYRTRMTNYQTLGNIHVFIQKNPCVMTKLHQSSHMIPRKHSSLCNLCFTIIF